MSYEHYNLNEIDPGQKDVPDGTYNFRIGAVDKKAFVAKTGENAGQPGEYVNVRFTIVESPDFSGRGVFSGFFPGERTQKDYRRLMDATGVPVPGAFESMDDEIAWLKEVQQAGATFSARLVTKTGKDGTPRQNMSGFSIAPAV